MRVGLKLKKRRDLSRETRDRSLMTVYTISSLRIYDLFPLPVRVRLFSSFQAAFHIHLFLGSSIPSAALSVETELLFAPGDLM
jgi:hypothetical protein